MTGCEHTFGPSVRVWWSVPKSGRDEDENEDALRLDPETRRFAVADGASTSARPEVWSRLLVDSFVGGSDPRHPAALEGLRERWVKEVWRSGLPWFAEEKLRDGAGAAFAGLAVDAAPASQASGKAADKQNEEKGEALGYRACAVGDSCVFHMRGTRLLVLVPCLEAAQFSRFPVLLHTDSALSAAPEGTGEATGTCRPGDVFILATDAVARALLEKYENAVGGSNLEMYVDTRKTFDRFVAEVRKGGSDDDMTVCVVKL